MTAEESTLKRIKGYLDYIATWHPASGWPLPAKMNRINQPRLTYLIRLAELIRGLDYQMLPHERMVKLEHDLVDVHNFLASLRGAEESQNLQQDMERLSAILSNIFVTGDRRDTVVEHLESWLSILSAADRKLGERIENLKAAEEKILSSQSARIQEIENETRDLIQKKLAVQDQLIEETKAKIQIADENVKKTALAYEAARQTAAEEGVTAFHSEFIKYADDHDKAAKEWLYAAIGCLVVAIVAIIVFYSMSHREEKQRTAANAAVSTNGNAADKNTIEHGSISTTELLNTTITRVIILTLIMYALHWCGRNYRAHRHQAVICRQKELALRTFRSFAAASQDPKEKEAILRAATRFVFSHSATGYLGKDEMGPTDKLIEVLGSK